MKKSGSLLLALLAAWLALPLAAQSINPKQIQPGTNGQVMTTTGGAAGWTNPATALSLTTTGTSGAATLSGGVLNIPQYAGAVSSLTTTGTSGASTLSGGVLNIPQYQGALTLTTTGSSGAATLVSNTLNIPQYGGGGIGSIVPGVNIACSPLVSGSCTGSSVTIGTTGPGIPGNALFIFTGNSINDDDSHVLSGAISVTAYTCNGSVCTVTNSGTNHLASGQWVSMRGCTDFAAFNAHMPSYLALATGYTIFPVSATGLSATQFEFPYTAATVSSSTACSAYSASPYMPYVTTSDTGMPAAASSNTYELVPNPVYLSGIVTNFSSMFGALAPTSTGIPAYIFLNGPNNDAVNCESAATIEGYYSTIFSDAHADGFVVAVGSPTAGIFNQQTAGCAIYNIQFAVDQWLRAQGKTTVQGATPGSTAYWDIYSDIGSIVNDGSNAALVASNSGFGPVGAKLAGDQLARDFFSSNSETKDRRTWVYGLGNSLSPSVANGYVYSPNSDSEIGTWQWWNTARANVAFAISSNSGYFGAFAAAVSIDNGLNNCPSSAPFCVGASAYITTAGKAYFANLNVSAIAASSGSNCLQINASGDISNTGSACGSGGPSPLTTKGDLWGYDTANDRVPVGSNGQVLTADSTQALGVKWATPAAAAGIPTCADTSGSGTAQSCTTSPSFTPTAGSSIVYTTTTANTGAGLTINVNSLGAKSVAKWQTTTTLTAGDLAANSQVVMTYDGTNWEMGPIANAPSGGGGGNYVNLGSAVTWSMGSGSGSFANGVFKVGTAGTSITASSIPGTYVDLIFECEGRGDASAAYEGNLITLNGDTGNDYLVQTIYSTGTSSPGTSNANGGTSMGLWSMTAASGTANWAGGGQVEIRNYAGTTFVKHLTGSAGFSTQSSTPNQYLYRYEAWWNSTAAVTSITDTIASGNIIAGSTCAIYGKN